MDNRSESCVMKLLRNSKKHDKAIRAGAEKSTLAISSKDISEQVYSKWFPRYKEATLDMDNRSEMVERCFAELEKDMNFVGCTAVDDQMQPEVPHTVDMLLK